MRTIVVTGMWGEAWEWYGRDFAKSFAEHWPAEVELVVYADRDLPLKRGEVRPLSGIPGHDAFLATYGDNPFATGRKKAAHADWKQGDIRKGYSWSHDAVKWFRQGLIPDDAAARLEGQAILCWLDADVITTSPVPTDWLDGLIGDHDGAYLGRVDSHSEIGLWAVRMPQGPGLTVWFANMYLTGAFLAERQSHSAFIWDRARERSGLDMLNLTPEGAGHVFRSSPLAPYLEHRKGHLKAGLR